MTYAIAPSLHPLPWVLPSEGQHVHGTSGFEIWDVLRTRGDIGTSVLPFNTKSIGSHLRLVPRMLQVVAGAYGPGNSTDGMHTSWVLVSLLCFDS